MNFHTNTPCMPGFDVQPLRSLSPVLPFPSFGDYQLFSQDLLDGPVQSLNIARPAEKSPEWDPRTARLVAEEGLCALPKKATVVPFSISPLTLAALLKQGAFDNIKIKAPTPQQRMLEDQKKPDGGATEVQRSQLSFLGGSLDVNMLVMYPVMVPVYVIKFKESDFIGQTGEQASAMTVVVTGWEETWEEDWVEEANGEYGIAVLAFT